MWNKTLGLFFLTVLVTFSFSCRREVTKLRSSVRRTQTEVRFYERTADALGGLVGADKVKSLSKNNN